MNPPLVSIVIPTRNRPHLLRLALASIATQHAFPVDTVETVVVNDGGTDVTAELRAAAAAGLRVQPLTLPKRCGLPTARNAGIDVARGKYLAFLDDDDVFLPHHLRTALDTLDGGGADAVYTTCLISTSRVDPTGPVPEAALANGYPFDLDLLSVANYIPVHSAVLRRPAFSEARFDRELTALEDWDFWLRLTQKYGYRFRHIAEPTVVYHRIPDQTSMCGAAVSNASALADFGDLGQRLWRRWPTTSPRAARFRAYIGVMYWHALSLLATGRPVANLYYQHSLRELAAAWTDIKVEDGLIDRIRQAVEGDSGVANVA